MIINSASPDNFRLLVSPILSIASFFMSLALSLSFFCWTDRLSSGLMVSSLSINSVIRTSFSVRSSTTTPLAAFSSVILDLNFRRSNTQRSLTPLLSLIRNCGESIWFSFSAIESHAPPPCWRFLSWRWIHHWQPFPWDSTRRVDRSTPSALYIKYKTRISKRRTFEHSAEFPSLQGQEVSKSK